MKPHHDLRVPRATMLGVLEFVGEYWTSPPVFPPREPITVIELEPLPTPKPRRHVVRRALEIVIACWESGLVIFLLGALLSCDNSAMRIL